VLFKNFIKNIFLTDPQLVTGKRFLRWKRLFIAGTTGAFLLLTGVAVFGQSKIQPDLVNYHSLSADDLNKHGVVILSGKDQSKSVQSRKIASQSYAGATGSDQGQVISRKEQSRSDYVIPAGSKIPVILDGDLNSELSQSPVTARLTSAFTFQGRTLLPAGTKVLGHLGQGQDSERIAVTFDQFVFPNGHQLSAQAFGIMPDGSPGIVGEFHSEKGMKMAAAIGSSFLSGAAGAYQSTQANSFGIQQPDNTSRNAILNGVAQSTLEQGKRFADDAQNKPGYVTAKSGASFQIYVEKETDLSGVYQ
jgi:type IV secretory pathway VirB10-like protein